MHFRDFRIVGKREDLGGFFGQVAKQVHADGKIACPNGRNGFGDFEKGGFLFLRVTGGAADDGFAQGGCRFEDAARDRVEGWRFRIPFRSVLPLDVPDVTAAAAAG